MRKRNVGRQLFLRGMWLGVKAGFIGAQLFILGYCIFAGAPKSMGEFWILLLGFGLLGQIFGTLPAILVGAIGGGVVGLVLRWVPTLAAPVQSALLGFFVATCAAGVVYVIGQEQGVYFSLNLATVTVVAIGFLGAIWSGYRLGTDAQLLYQS